MIFFIYNIISFIFGAHYPIKFPKLQLVNNINLINDMDNIYSINSRYKKTIKYSKFLKEENNMQVFNYDTINEGYELDISSMFITNISDFVYNNIKPRNIKNEILFLLNKKTKIYIHIEYLKVAMIKQQKHYIKYLHCIIIGLIFLHLDQITLIV